MPGTRVSLKEYVDARLSDHDVALKAALASNERRLDGMNEFRATLKDQQGMFVTRTELFAWIGVAAAVGALAGHFWR